MTNGPEETADPQPAGHIWQCLRWGRVGWFYSHELLRRSGCAEASRCVSSVVSGARERCERCERAERQQDYKQPAKAQRLGEPRGRRGGRAWRVGTQSGYGWPGGPGFFGGAAAVLVSTAHEKRACELAECLYGFDSMSGHERADLFFGAKSARPTPNKQQRREIRSGPAIVIAVYSYLPIISVRARQGARPPITGERRAESFTTETKAD